ncbi:MAG: bifunctional hydroxymethylpyrimidine kinase/phosphomethylpyrimidine kinase [Bryobacteraceae bacterium]
MLRVALTIAGSDPSGGAGIQADLKTFHQFGVYGEAVLTLLTVQNTLGVTRIEALAPDLVRQQLEAVLLDIPPAAAKTGALGNAAVVNAIADMAPSFGFPLVVDPVLIGKHGSRLLSSDAENDLKRKLLPQAFLISPNIFEAEVLTGMDIRNEIAMREAALRLMDLGCGAVLIKGGHRSGSPLDVLADSNGLTLFDGKRVNTPHTHGTGCTYSAAITAGLALGNDLREAVRRAKSFMQSAIETSPGLGHGNGPLNHFAPIL